MNKLKKKKHTDAAPVTCRLKTGPLFCWLEYEESGWQNVQVQQQIDGAFMKK